ncbi:DUF4253 domain-containing protein [bacterium]|nr:MAG: DUF4253 domain-containing protein [bacterium]
MSEQVWFENSLGSVLIVKVPASEALAVWKRYRSQVEETGRWPVIIGNEESVRIQRESAERNVDVRERLRQAEELQPQAIIKARLDELFEEEEEDELFGEDFKPSALQTGNPDPHDAPAILREEGEISIALLPSRHGWEAPAHLEYGSWNEYPSIAEHVALLRDWEKRYGAEMLVLSSDTVELLLSRPLTNVDEAKKVAAEWLAYSSDNDAGSLQFLAQGMLNTRFWISWWD